MTPSGLKSFGLLSTRPSPSSAPASAIFDARRQVLVQGGLVACCSAAGYVFGGLESAIAALLGGMAALAGTLSFLGVLKWRNRVAPTPWEALRVLVMAEAAKWAVSLVGLVSLLSGRAGVEVAGAAPGAVVIGFCVAWVAPLLALMKRN
jgi:F0F1-type ATP synthase assembly protein I